MVRTSHHDSFSSGNTGSRAVLVLRALRRFVGGGKTLVRKFSCRAIGSRIASATPLTAAAWSALDDYLLLHLTWA